MATNKISAQELKELRATFDKYDASKDGKLQVSELVQLFTDLKVPNPKATAEKLVKEVDVNNDGDISYGEFLKAYLPVRHAKGDISVSLREFVEDVIHEEAEEHKKNEKPIKFVFHAPAWVKEAQIAGLFNHWHGEAFSSVGNGVFEHTIYLTPGHHEYKYKVRPSHEHGLIDEHYGWIYDHTKPHHHDRSGHINNFINVE